MQMEQARSYKLIQGLVPSITFLYPGQSGLYVWLRVLTGCHHHAYAERAESLLTNVDRINILQQTELISCSQCLNIVEVC